MNTKALSESVCEPLIARLVFASEVPGIFLSLVKKGELFCIQGVLEEEERRLVIQSFILYTETLYLEMKSFLFFMIININCIV